MDACKLRRSFSLRYELRFKALFAGGRDYVFPCDAHGHVDMDALSNRARENYLYARTVIGRALAQPAVEPVAPTLAHDASISD